MLANAGDSRAVLYDHHGVVCVNNIALFESRTSACHSTDNIVFFLLSLYLLLMTKVRATTEDHKPQSAREAARIRAVDGES